MASSSQIRLLVVTITGTSKLEVALQIQESWQKFLGPQDVTAIICDVGCSTASPSNNTSSSHTLRRQQNVIELDPDLVNSIARPWQFENDDNRWGYRLAQLKFYFGLVSQMRHFVAEHENDPKRNPIPQWILIKDDDTYVHADRLMQVVEGVDFEKEKVSLAGGWAGRDIELRYWHGISGEEAYGDDEGPPKGCHWPDGGGGWLFSQAMALELAIHRGDQVLDFMRHKIEHSQWSFHYDIWIPEIASWGGGRLYHSPTFATTLHPGRRCYDHKTKTSSFASVHMKEYIGAYELRGALTSLEYCMRRSFTAPTGELLRERIQKNETVRYCPTDME